MGDREGSKGGSAMVQPVWCGQGPGASLVTSLSLNLSSLICKMEAGITSINNDVQEAFQVPDKVLLAQSRLSHWSFHCFQVLVVFLGFPFLS